jgi:periplasmic protein TonB
LFPLCFQAIGHQCRTLLAEIAAQADGSAGRELAPAIGVYRNVFEQSLLLNQDTKRPWNFLASLGAELLLISLALLIPLLYRDHLPAVHWKDIVVGPAPQPEPVPVAQPSRGTNTTQVHALARPLYLDPRASLRSAPAASIDLALEAPPTLGPGYGGSNSTLGTYIPNVVAAPPPPPKRPEVETPTLPSGPIPVTSDLQMAKLLRKVIPDYPPIARAAGISGIVRLIGTIGKDGAIQNLQVISGHPMLARAALEAVRQWVYKPTLLNGKPVEVIAPIEVSFTLAR